MLVKLLFFSLGNARYNSIKNLEGSRKPSFNSLQKNFHPQLREKAANHGRLDARKSRKWTVLFKYGVSANKAKIFEIHLRCADPRSILATMFHGQKVLSARPKPCCRLAVFQIRLSSKTFLQTPQKSNVSVGFKHGGREILKCHGLCALHEAAPDFPHAPRSGLAAHECKPRGRSRMNGGLF